MIEARRRASRSLRRPARQWVLFAATLVNRAGWMVLPFITLDLDAQPAAARPKEGVVIAVYGVAGLATSPIAGALSDRLFGAVRVMRASLFLSAAVLFAFLLATSYLAVLGATALLGFVARALHRPASSCSSSAVARRGDERPAFASRMRSPRASGMSVGPAVGGLLGMSFTLLFVADAVTTPSPPSFRWTALRADAGNDAGHARRRAARSSRPR